MDHIIKKVDADRVFILKKYLNRNTIRLTNITTYTGTHEHIRRAISAVAMSINVKESFKNDMVCQSVEKEVIQKKKQRK